MAVECSPLFDGVCFSAAGRYTEALSSLQTASKCDRSSSLPHSSLASVYSAVGDPHSAAKHHLVAVQLAPRRPNVLLNIAMFLHRHGASVRRIF